MSCPDRWMDVFITKSDDDAKTRGRSTAIGAPYGFDDEFCTSVQSVRFQAGYPNDAYITEKETEWIMPTWTGDTVPTSWSEIGVGDLVRIGGMDTTNFTDYLTVVEVRSVTKVINACSTAVVTKADGTASLNVCSETSGQATDDLPIDGSHAVVNTTALRVNVNLNCTRLERVLKPNDYTWHIEAGEDNGLRTANSGALPTSITVTHPNGHTITGITPTALAIRAYVDGSEADHFIGNAPENYAGNNYTHSWRAMTVITNRIRQPASVDQTEPILQGKLNSLEADQTLLPGVNGSGPVLDTSGTNLVGEAWVANSSSNYATNGFRLYDVAGDNTKVLMYNAARVPSSAHVTAPATINIHDLSTGPATSGPRANGTITSAFIYFVSGSSNIAATDDGAIDSGWTDLTVPDTSHSSTPAVEEWSTNYQIASVSQNGSLSEGFVPNSLRNHRRLFVSDLSKGNIPAVDGTIIWFETASDGTATQENYTIYDVTEEPGLNYGLIANSNFNYSSFGFSTAGGTDLGLDVIASAPQFCEGAAPTAPAAGAPVARGVHPLHAHTNEFLVEVDGTLTWPVLANRNVTVQAGVNIEDGTGWFLANDADNYALHGYTISKDDYVMYTNNAAVTLKPGDRFYGLLAQVTSAIIVDATDKFLPPSDYSGSGLFTPVGYSQHGAVISELITAENAAAYGVTTLPDTPIYVTLIQQEPIFWNIVRNVEPLVYWQVRPVYWSAAPIYWRLIDNTNTPIYWALRHDDKVYWRYVPTIGKDYVWQDGVTSDTDDSVLKFVTLANRHEALTEGGERYYPVYVSKNWARNSELVARLDHGVKQVSCVKLMGYSLVNKRQVGIQHAHEMQTDDYLILRIQEIEGKVISNNRYANGAFAILRCGDTTNTMIGAAEYSTYEPTGLVTVPVDSTSSTIKNVTIQLTDRNGNVAHFGRLHLWFKLLVTHG